jgi:N-acetylneuraminate synthase/N,N'-diacetyllegionaminate synthase
MQIDGVSVGEEAPPYFIAEAGVNHNGDMDLAEDLIDAAASAGAAAVKFQTFSADRLVTQNAPQADYQEEHTDEENQREMLERYELSRADHRRLITYCENEDITFLSTPFDPDSASFLAECDVSAIKLGSGELDNHPLLNHVAGLDRPLVVSTGMGTMDEVTTAYDVINSTENPPDVAFLHCTSAYPAAIDDVNLRAMQSMAKELPVPIGYSDHTTEPETPAFAVAAGATILEKHFTMDRSLPGPDHEASLEPDELDRAVDLANMAWRALGSPEKRPTESESRNIETIRKGIYAAKEIATGEEISEDDLRVLRPATGLSPKHMDRVVGSRATTQIKEGTPVNRSDIESSMQGDT